MSKKVHGDSTQEVQNGKLQDSTTPLVTGEKYQKEDGSQKVDGSMYRSLIGSLLYLTATRPDIMFATSLLSRFMQSPSQVHYAAAKRILRYLRDSDWAGSVDDMKSTSGYTFSLGSGIFSWASKKQATVAQSSAEAEYIAAAATSNQAIWLRRILEDMGEKQEEPTRIYCDNKSAIAITKNPVQHSRTNISTSSITLCEKQLPEERLNSSTAALKSN
ncbi:UNVERIFIED_CONTAM: Retrovirus-related Pol polyprotein from transposon RE2 [Sesamum angustifolium]|uniref:Retrovirus-related Pol polyprotein from transposon RE2 n=1 Tax=Sesamum angustifolium TaxID=2727405 RepID=A0AAW2Q9S0_9LAMI